MNRIILIAFAVAAALLLSACGSTRELERIAPTRSPEEVLAALTGPGGDRLPGVAVSVIKGGETVYRGAAGVRKTGSPEKVTIADPFHLGSDTKAMTALICGILVDRGLLSWDSTITEILGAGYPCRAEYHDITLEQLLSHTAGLPAAIPTAQWLEFFPYDSPRGNDRERMVSVSLSLAPVSEPGSAFLYSNLGYVIAGYMAERAAGKSWETLMRTELFEPLGMTGAGFGPPARGDSQGASGTGRDSITAPWGHAPQPVDPAYEYADNPAALGPAGTCHASVLDLERYLSVYRDGGTGITGRRMVSTETIDELTTPRLEGYALGWLTGVSDQGKRFLSHDGSNTMFYCSITVFPDDADAVIVLANRGDGEAPLLVTELALYLAERFLSATVSGIE